MTAPGPSPTAPAPGGWQPNGYREAPPNRRRLVLAIAAALVLLTGGIVAAVAFGGDAPAPAAAPASGPAPTPVAVPSAKRVVAEAVGDAFFADLQGHSVAGLRSLTCDGVEVTLTTKYVDQITSTLPVGPVQVDTSTAQMDGHVFFADQELATITLYLRREGARFWCVYSIGKA